MTSVRQREESMTALEMLRDLERRRAENLTRRGASAELLPGEDDDDLTTDEDITEAGRIGETGVLAEAIGERDVLGDCHPRTAACLSRLAAISDPSLLRDTLWELLDPGTLGILRDETADLAAAAAGQHPEAVANEHVSRVVHAAALSRRREVVELFRGRLKKPDFMLEMMARTWRHNGLTESADLLELALK